VSADPHLPVKRVVGGERRARPGDVLGEGTGGRVASETLTVTWSSSIGLSPGVTARQAAARVSPGAPGAVHPAVTPVGADGTTVLAGVVTVTGAPARLEPPASVLTTVTA
jgi:hypothetical protein